VPSSFPHIFQPASAVPVPIADACKQPTNTVFIGHNSAHTCLPSGLPFFWVHSLHMALCALTYFWAYQSSKDSYNSSVHTQRVWPNAFGTTTCFWACCCCARAAAAASACCAAALEGRGASPSKAMRSSTDIACTPFKQAKTIEGLFWVFRPHYFFSQAFRRQDAEDSKRKYCSIYHATHAFFICLELHTTLNQSLSGTIVPVHSAQWWADSYIFIPKFYFALLILCLYFNFILLQ
jgi:hypothetical protein